MTFFFLDRHLLWTLLLIPLLVIYVIHLIRYLLNTPLHLTFNPPKAHLFVQKELKSATNNLVIALAALSPLMYNIILNSAYLFSAGMYLSVYSHAISHLPIEVLIRIMNFIIQNTIDMSTQAQGLLNNPSTSLEMLREVHAYLTPYIRSYESMFHFIGRIVLYLQYIESDFTLRIVGLQREFFNARGGLMDVYRRIEVELSITMYDSPISIQDWELD